jgi:hypothetical protein
LKVVKPRLGKSERLSRRRHPILLVICFGLTVIASSGLDAQTLSGTATPSITINAAVAGSEPTAKSNSGSKSTYSGKTYISKITVSTVCPSQKFDLSVIATGTFTGHGTPLSVTLVNGMLAADFITNIPVNALSNTASLQYTCAPQFADGTGTDTHTVTYTQVLQ